LPELLKKIAGQLCESKTTSYLCRPSTEIVDGSSGRWGNFFEEKDCKVRKTFYLCSPNFREEEFGGFGRWMNLVL
jgi:hypothetical protein